MLCLWRVVASLSVAVLMSVPAAAQAPVTYRVAFPAPEHHYAVIEVTFPNLPPVTLETRMSRSSPGRYALHEYAKNVFELQAFDGAGKELPVSRPNPYQWDVAGARRHRAHRLQDLRRPRRRHLSRHRSDARAHEHAGDVLWARGLEARASESRSSRRRARLGRRRRSCSRPTSPWTFTAPNLQYLMDSPTELSAQTIRTFTVRGARRQGRDDPRRHPPRRAATPKSTSTWPARRRSSRSTARSSASCRQFEPGTTRFSATTCRGAAVTAWSIATAPSSRRRYRCAAPAACSTCSTPWLARVLSRLERRAHPAEVARAVQFRRSEHVRRAVAGRRVYAVPTAARHGPRGPRRPRDETAGDGRAPRAQSMNMPGRQFRSAVAMSQLAPFTDAARPSTRPIFPQRSSSYYTYGSAIALAHGSDAARSQSNGKISLDDYMRAMWACTASRAVRNPASSAGRTR